MASLKDSVRNSELGNITTAAGATSYLKVYTGSAPSKTAAPTGTLLASFSLPNPIAPAASAGVLTLSSISNATAAASGTPGYYRITDSNTDDGTHTIMQGTSGVGSGELNWNSTIASGGTCAISSFTVTEGNA